MFLVVIMIVVVVAFVVVVLFADSDKSCEIFAKTEESDSVKLVDTVSLLLSIGTVSL